MFCIHDSSPSYRKQNLARSAHFSNYIATESTYWTDKLEQYWRSMYQFYSVSINPYKQLLILETKESPDFRSKTTDSSAGRLNHFRHGRRYAEIIERGVVSSIWDDRAMLVRVLQGIVTWSADYGCPIKTPFLAELVGPVLLIPIIGSQKQPSNISVNRQE